ncbi:MAG TPA: hypothetical protein DD806_03350 [Flavobacterium sp.]|nr:hypothetical protein [Flavobacterium sp.]
MDLVKKSGSSKTNRLVNESFARTLGTEQGPSDNYVEGARTPQYEKKEKIKVYRHGNSAIVTKVGDAYKGYYGHVTDFFPATYELKTEGEAYIETDTIMNQDITGKVMTKFGEGKVLEKIAATQQGADYIDFVIYTDRETSKQKIGLYVDETDKIISYLESEGNDSNQAYITRENKNNNFVRELKQDNLVEMMKRLQTDSIQELVESLNSIDLNEKTDSLIELLKTSVETWEYNGEDMLFKNGYAIQPKIQDILFDRKISIVFNKDIIGPHHYMIVSGQNKGWNNVYKPDQDYYKISYTLVVKYKPGEINVNKQDKRYASVKKGDYAGKKFLIVKYNKAKMMLRLSSNNREFVYEPSDVFYFDLKLTNGNVAEVVDTLRGNKLKIREKVESSNTMETRIISEDEIAEKLSGFTLSDTEREPDTPGIPVEINPFDNFYIPDQQAEPEEQFEEIFDDEFNEDKSQSGDYDEPEETNEIEREELIEGETSEGQVKASFKDTERTSNVMEELTSKQKEILNMIKKASNSFGYYLEEYDILSKVENVIECLKRILNKTSISDYNIRFIIVLVVMYEAIKNSIDHDFDKIINKLFKGENSKGFFSAKDLSAENRNNFIFFESLLGDRSESISKIIKLTKNKKQTFGENKDILKELILYADSIVQKCLGLTLNIRRKYELDLSQLIPVGINQETGRRYKDEMEENALLRSQKMREMYYTSKNILDNIELPSNEVSINWDFDSKKILDKFVKGLTKKARQQPEASEIILTIRDNLYRAPFAIRDDELDSFTRSNFETVFLNLKSSIIEYKENKLNDIKIENERINQNRKRIYEEKEELFGTDMDIDETEPGVEEKLSKRQRLYNIENSLRKAQVAANRFAYADKAKEKKAAKKAREISEETED